MKEPKFRAQCECGAKSPRPATDYTTQKWMNKHRTTHIAPTCEHAYGLGQRCIHCNTLKP